MLRRCLLALSVALAAGLVGAPAHAAKTPSEWPAVNQEWPACANASAQYCVDAVTVTPVDGISAPASQYGLRASVVTAGRDIMRWDLDGLRNAAPEIRGGVLRLVLRTGPFTGHNTTATARNLRLSSATDAAGNRTMTITGRAAPRDATAKICDGNGCGGPDTTANADRSGATFGGTTDTWTSGGYDTGYLATDASTVVERSFGDTPDVALTVANPHLRASGDAARGFVSLWLPPRFFETRGTTAAAAAATGYDAVVGTGEAAVSVPVTLVLRDGGLTVDVPDFGYTGLTRIALVNRPSTAVRDTGAPASPQAVRVAHEHGLNTVSWAAPASDGGDPVTAYTARAFAAATGGSVVGRCETVSTSCAIGGLTAGRAYYVAVSATNRFGEGPAAARVATPVPPSAPRLVIVAPQDRSLTVTWAEPALGGNAALTGYAARAYEKASGGDPVAGCTPVGVARRCTIAGLANGTQYWVTVRATNEAGAGRESARKLGTPRTLASAPRSVAASSSGRRVRVSWTAPASTGGAAVRGYTVTLYATATESVAVARCTAPAPARACSTGYLPIGATYYAAVTATNLAGPSPASARVRVIVRR